MKRVVFTFDSDSLRALKRMAAKAGHDTLGEALRDALSILQTLYNLREDGYTEVLVRNPKTGEERMLCWK